MVSGGDIENPLDGVVLGDDLVIRSGVMNLINGTAIDGKITFDTEPGHESRIILGASQHLTGVTEVVFERGVHEENSLFWEDEAAFAVAESQQVHTGPSGGGEFGSISGVLDLRGDVSASSTGGQLTVYATETTVASGGQLSVSNGSSLHVEAGEGVFHRANSIVNNGLISSQDPDSLLVLNAALVDNNADLQLDRGRIQAQGNLVLNSGSVLAAVFDPATSDSDPGVAVSDVITLGGDLVITTDSEPVFGDRFQVFTAASVSGTFSSIVLPTIAGTWDTSLLEVNGLLQVVSIEGDLDGDGYVGAEDLDVVLANWGQAVGLGDRLQGDSTGDGLVGGSDLQVVLDNWGSGEVPGGIVPEPSSLWSFAAGLMFLRRRRHRS